MTHVSDDDEVQQRIERIFFDDYIFAEPSERYIRLYGGGSDAITLGLADLHERLNNLFKFMNSKSNGHFNAEQSRQLIDLRHEINGLRAAVSRAGNSLSLSSTYEATLEGADEWLVPTGGSPIPDGFTPVETEWHEPIFVFGQERRIDITERDFAELRTEGEGSFAKVESFIDSLYGVRVARKVLVSPATSEEKFRFKQEFEIMKQLNFPYILRVYTLANDERSYTMEYCENTLDTYIAEQKDPAVFNLAIRRRIALQFLNGLNYLHTRNICHRDLSYNNVLVKRYDNQAVMLKLSDFGFAKPHNSDFTKTAAEIFGSIVDPSLDNFKHFKPVNDIYAVGFILSYIFTGRKKLLSDDSPISRIIHKCSHSEPAKRYQYVFNIINDLENVKFYSGPMPTA